MVRALAADLRAVILAGPSKTRRVPFIVGATNSGKSTLVYPFDDLFGKAHVFHLPALGAPCPLRNIVKAKRFVFWDEFDPVEYAVQGTLSVMNYKKFFKGDTFEIQVPLNVHDGHLDVEWKRGMCSSALLTNRRHC